MNIVRPKFDRKPQCLVFVLSKKLTAIADGCRCLKGVWGVGWVKSGMCRHPKRNIQTSFLWLISLFFLSSASFNTCFRRSCSDHLEKCGRDNQGQNQKRVQKFFKTQNQLTKYQSSRYLKY